MILLIRSAWCWGKFREHKTRENVERTNRPVGKTPMGQTKNVGKRRVHERQSTENVEWSLVANDIDNLFLCTQMILLICSAWCVAMIFLICSCLRSVSVLDLSSWVECSCFLLFAHFLWCVAVNSMYLMIFIFQFELAGIVYLFNLIYL